MPTMAMSSGMRSPPTLANFRWLLNSVFVATAVTALVLYATFQRRITAGISFTDMGGR